MTRKEAIKEFDNCKILSQDVVINGKIKTVTTRLEIKDPMTSENKDNEILAAILLINNRLDVMSQDITTIKSEIVIMKDEITEIKSDILQMKNEIAEIKLDILQIKSEVREIREVLVKHDQAMVAHGWFDKPNII